MEFSPRPRFKIHC